MDFINSGELNGGSYRTLTDLPYEIIELILSSEQISHVDICRISEVCQKLYAVSCSPCLWHTKFCQAWRSLSELYDNCSLDWKLSYQQRWKYGRHVQKLVATMCEEARHVHELVAATDEQPKFGYLVDNLMSKFKDLSAEHRFASRFMLDEMDSILYDGNRYTRLTTKFYCTKLLYFSRQHHLKKVFQNFLARYENCHQPLDIGAMIISQFCQPLKRIDFRDISKKLDDIAQCVKGVVKQNSPNHPVLHQDIIPTSAVLRKSLWSPSDCKIILTCLNYTLFQNLEFKCVSDEEDYEVLYFDHTFIDKVLESKAGISVVIGIIYASVAHRLGVLCKLCEPGTTVLKWMEHPMLDLANRYTFIDITKCGRFFTAAEFSLVIQVHMSNETEFPSKLPSQIYKDIIKSLTFIGGRNVHYLEARMLYESSALELHLILSPNDKQTLLMLAQIYMQMEIRLFEVKDLLLRIAPRDLSLSYRVERLHVELEKYMKPFHREARSQKPPKKLREKCPSVSFAVGMIMKHKKYDYVCVIYGWDKICHASDHWIQQMRVLELRYKNNQPFYNVLVEDGTQRYAAQENLEICDTPRFIEHPEVGKYFDEFQNTHFVPNEMTSAEYPQDDSAREIMLSEFFALREDSPVDV